MPQVDKAHDKRSDEAQIADESEFGKNAHAQ
jgi:hypothetical protein